MTIIVVRLHGQIASDHVRGCMGRQYSCDCGYDAETEKLLAEAADEIELLRTALPPFAKMYAAPGGDLDQAIQNARAALEQKP